MAQTQILKLINIKSVIYTFIFTALAVSAPMAAHQLAGAQAGRMILPMHLFIITAGLLLGWRAGLMAGLMSPLISFSLTGLPLPIVLPFIVIELASYGLLSGIFFKILKLNIWLALLGAMIFGRIILWLALLALPTKIIASQYMIGIMQAGWPGVLLQLLLAPVLVKIFTSYIKDENI